MHVSKLFNFVHILAFFRQYKSGVSIYYQGSFVIVGSKMLPNGGKQSRREWLVGNLHRGKVRFHGHYFFYCTSRFVCVYILLVLLLMLIIDNSECLFNRWIHILFTHSNSFIYNVTSLKKTFPLHPLASQFPYPYPSPISQFPFFLCIRIRRHLMLNGLYLYVLKRILLTFVHPFYFDTTSIWGKTGKSYMKNQNRRV
jgi:hypothetical protein